MLHWMKGTANRRSLFVRGLRCDAAPSVEALVEHFTCKYSCLITVLPTRSPSKISTMKIKYENNIHYIDLEVKKCILI